MWRRHVRFYGALVIIACWFTLAMLAALPRAEATSQCGRASWYSAGAVTANGERFNPEGITAAHRSLGFGSSVRVTRSDTGASVVVRINDRGPYVGGRIIDLALGSARAIGMVEQGVVPVCLEVLA